MEVGYEGSYWEADERKELEIAQKLGHFEYLAQTFIHAHFLNSCGRLAFSLTPWASQQSETQMI